MKKIISSVILAAVVAGVCAAGNIDIKTLASRLGAAQDFAAKVDYKVLLPSADEPICYTITLASSANEGDSLAAADYLLEWSLEKDGNKSDGFTAYFNGDYYRYRDQLLREYHYSDEPEVFAPGCDVSKGIQNQTQFCDLLPQYISSAITSMTSDSTYYYTIHADTVIAQQRVIAIDGVRSYRGEEAQRFIYVFDRDLMPVSMEITNNPGHIGEQVISATYDYSGEPLATVRSEDELAARYPEIFAKYRERNFSLENLPGRRLPAFSSPTPTGERYTFNKNSRFARQTIIAIVDADDVATSEVITGLRKHVSETDEKPDLIFAFINNNAEAIEAAAGKMSPGEHILMSARGLARDCGVTTTPLIIECDIDGTVTSVKGQQ